MRLTQFGYNTVVACWLLPIVLLSVYGNASSTGSASDFYAMAFVVSLVLLIFAAVSAYQNMGSTSPTATAKSLGSDDIAVVSFDTLATWKWAYCFMIGVIAGCSAITHYIMNREAQGIMATALLLYSVVDIAIAIISFNQFWRLKKEHIIQLSNKTADSMFHH